MGGCLSADVDDRQKQGGLQSHNASQYAREADQAVALLTGASAVTSLVDIHVKCTNLIDADIRSKSDPMVVLFQRTKAEWKEVSRTEVIANNLNPEFVKALRVLYNFEMLQNLLLRVYEIDGDGKNPALLDLSKQTVLGETEFLLSELVAAEGKRLRKKLTNPKRQHADAGEVTLTAEELANQNALVTIRFGATALSRKDVFGSSDPFVRISRCKEDGTWVPVFKTEVIMNNLNPEWSSFDITSQQLCNGDVDRPLRLEVFDWDRDGSHDLIGQTETSLSQLQAMGTDAQMPLIDPAKKGTANYTNDGVLWLRLVYVKPRPSFLDYIAGGCELKFMVAIDFTYSNKPPHDPQSLHYLDPSGQPTAYEQAIMAIGRVLEFYNADKMFPLWGFGGQVGNNPVSHCFALNGNEFAPEVQGVQEILQAYRGALGSVSLSGPTLFQRILAQAAGTAAAPAGPCPHHPGRERQKYLVLLILTDGVIMDMQPTIKAIVEAADLPLSVLIVGVGQEDFSAMEVLDGDNERLSYNGRKASRDIVQFVPFDQHKQGHPDELAAELLAELPGQLLQYYGARHILPNPPRQTNSQRMAANGPSAPSAGYNGGM